MKDFLTKEDKLFWEEQTKDVKKAKFDDEKLAKKKNKKINKLDKVYGEGNCDEDLCIVSSSNQELLNFKKMPKLQDIEILSELTLDDNSSGIDKNTYKKFKSGKMLVDGRLDLHGQTQKEAYLSFVKFINNAYDNGKRKVIVITGKGFLSKKGGVLKRSLPNWVNDVEIRSKILSFSYAQPKDGGSGAYYILLKKKK